MHPASMNIYMFSFQDVAKRLLREFCTCVYWKTLSPFLMPHPMATQTQWIGLPSPAG